MHALEIAKPNMDEDKTLTVEVWEEDFEAKVLRSPQPVLVAFWAAWSRACDILDWQLEVVAAECAGKARILKVNADQCPDLCAWYRVESIPTLLLFVDGNLRRKIVGAASQQTILELLPSSRTRKKAESFPSSTGQENQAHRNPDAQPIPIPGAFAALKGSF